jgi:hypothetical protein
MNVPFQPRRTYSEVSEAMPFMVIFGVVVSTSPRDCSMVQSISPMP